MWLPVTHQQCQNTEGNLKHWRSTRQKSSIGLVLPSQRRLRQRRHSHASIRILWLFIIIRLMGGLQKRWKNARYCIRTNTLDRMICSNARNLQYQNCRCELLGNRCVPWHITWQAYSQENPWIFNLWSPLYGQERQTDMMTPATGHQ